MNRQRIRIVGRCDGLLASTRQISVLLDTGEEVKGDFADGQIDSIRNLMGKRVVMLGTAYYLASGQLVRIEADMVSAAKAEPAIFSRIPTPPHAQLDRAKLRQAQGPCSGMAAILGQWPGDESEEEIRAALDKLS
jgi:hypothetical protein